MARVKTISILDDEVAKHLSKQSNISSYVCSLIKEDMNRDPRISVLATSLLDIIESLKLL